MVNAKLSLSFPKWENESRTRYFPYINRLVKCPLNERKRTVQPRFPCAGKSEVNSIFSWCYSAFHKHANSEVQKPTDDCVFRCVDHLNGPLRKQNFTLTGSKGHGSWFVIGGFGSVLCVSVFQGLLLVLVITIDGSEKRNCEGGFWTLEFACLSKGQ